MKKKMKKILSLGTVALALSPMAGVVACGSSSSKTPAPKPEPGPKPSPTVDPKLAVARADANNIIDSLKVTQDGWKTADQGFALKALEDQIKKSKSNVDKAMSVADVKKLVESPTSGTEIALVITQRDAYNLVDKYKGTLTADGVKKFNSIKNNTTIAEDTFKNETGLTAIDLKSGVVTIAKNAFVDSPLTTMNLPDSLTTIGEGAFKAALLADLTIKSNVTAVGISAFESSPLTTLTLSSTLSTISASAFKSAQLTTLTIPDSVTTIGESAFENSQLTSLTLSGSLTSIGTKAFESSLLTTLTIPDSVTTIAENAFESSPLTNLTVSTKATTIGSHAFKSTVNETTTTVTMPWEFQDDDAKKNIFGLDTAHPDSIKIVFVYPDKPEKPASPELALARFQAKSIINSININQNGWKTTDDNFAWNEFQGVIKGAIARVDQANTIAEVQALVKSQTEGTAIVEIIAKKGLYTGLNKYQGTLDPNDLVNFKAIGNSISANEFQNAVTVTALDLKTVTSIGNGAFINAPLTSLTLSDKVTSIGDAAFQLSKLTDLTLPSTLASLGASAFRDSILTTLTIPSSLTTINANTFASSKLISLTIPDNITSIGDGAFKSSPLANLTVSTNVTSIGANAFQGIVNDATTNVTMPWAFQDDDNKKRIFGFADPATSGINFVYPDSPKPSVPPELAAARANANAIIDGLDMSQDGWKTDTDDHGQAWSAFEGAITKARTDILNTTTVAEVEALVKSKTEGTAVESIIPKKDLYNGLNKYKGTLSSDLLITRFNNLKNNSHVHRYSFNNWNTYTGLMLKSSITEVEEGAFQSGELCTTLVLPDTLTTIGHDAFGWLPLTTLVIPQSVTSIGHWAFHHVKQGAHIWIPIKFKSQISSIFNKPEQQLNITYT